MRYLAANDPVDRPPIRTYSEREHAVCRHRRIAPLAEGFARRPKWLLVVTDGEFNGFAESAQRQIDTIVKPLDPGRLS